MALQNDPRLRQRVRSFLHVNRPLATGHSWEKEAFALTKGHSW